MPLLSECKPGARGKFVRIDSWELQVALMSLGVIPGESFTLTEIAPLGDPLAVDIGGSKVAIRMAQAKHITVETIG